MSDLNPTASTTTTTTQPSDFIPQSSHTTSSPPAQSSDSLKSAFEALLLLRHAAGQQSPSQPAKISTTTTSSSSSSWTSSSSPPASPQQTSAVSSAMASAIPAHFTALPPLRDLLQTESSVLQDATLEEVLPFLSSAGTAPSSSTPLRPNAHGVPNLLRGAHVAFLRKSLAPLPAPYTAADAGRPWFFYWALCGLATLGEDVSVYRRRLVDTVRACQHPLGGFGGGHGQLAHLAPSYAVLLALALVAGGTEDDGGKDVFEVVDRDGMWRWLARCKGPDGAFSMSVGGEVDVRGAYCAVVMISLLNLPIELPEEEQARLGEGTTLLTGLAEWVGRCQSFEGGISACPDAEAHGAYAFCALACLCVLGPPHEIVPKFSDAYHTCYVLAGLSAAQHRWSYPRHRANKPYDSGNILTSAYHHHPAENPTYAHSASGTQVFDEAARVEKIHPVFVVSDGAAERMRRYFVALGDLRARP